MLTEFHENSRSLVGDDVRSLRAYQSPRVIQRLLTLSTIGQVVSYTVQNHELVLYYIYLVGIWDAILSNAAR